MKTMNIIIDNATINTTAMTDMELAFYNAAIKATNEVAETIMAVIRHDEAKMTSYMEAILAIKEGIKNNNLFTKMVWGYPISSIRNKDGKEVAHIVDGVSSEKEDIAVVFTKHGNFMDFLPTRKEAYEAWKEEDWYQVFGLKLVF